MLDVSLDRVSFARGSFALRDITLTFAASSHTAIIGPPACGASTLLQLIAGRLRPESGEIRIGSRVVNDLRESRRPLLYVTSDLAVPGRWSVRHALVAAVRQRSLDRIDRQREHDFALEKWKLESLIDRPLRTLSATERTLVHIARIELLRPGILIADRLLEHLSPAANVAMDFHRSLRVAGTTVISAPASRNELGMTDHVVVISGGRIVQEGNAAHVYSQPADEAAATATGAVNVIPVTIDGKTVESVIGSWEAAQPPFQGSGVALVRPDAFSVAARGAESDLIVAVEEASFENGRWLVRAILSGGVTLDVSLPSATNLHKGKLLALIYDSTQFPLLAREMAPTQRSVPNDAVPPMRSSR